MKSRGGSLGDALRQKTTARLVQRFVLPPFHGPPPFPAMNSGRPNSSSFSKNGRREAASPPDPGWFSPELGPVCCARCPRPGPLEQPHHQQPAVLPEQLLPVRAGLPALSGVSFIVLTWHPNITANILEVCTGNTGLLHVSGLAATLLLTWLYMMCPWRHTPEKHTRTGSMCEITPHCYENSSEHSA